jgi:hypothetical protein
MTELLFTSNEGDDYFLVPSVQLQERPKPLASGERLQFTLPASLCGLEEPTLHESLGVLRFLAFRLARVLYIAEWPDGLFWYESYYEDTTFDDYLEVATALLAALSTNIVSTSETGEITVAISPIVEELREFFVNDFVPMAHYLRNANPEGDEDFEYDFDDAFIGEDALRKIYSLKFFYEKNRIIDLDHIFNHGSEDSDDMGVIAVKKDGESPLLSSRNFSEPLDRVLLSIIGVLQFFKMSSEIGDDTHDDDEPTLEDHQRDLREYIEEFPDEEESARESFQKTIDGELYDYEFCAESIALHELGITSIRPTDDAQWFHATLTQPANSYEFAEKLGFLDDPDSFSDPFTDDEPAGMVRLGWYEFFFFTHEEEDDDDANEEEGDD